MENLYLYNTFRSVPKEAQKTITGGNLNGFTDINPMWRIKMLTEAFGPCGIGWYTEITKQWTEECADGRTAAFCNINLYINTGDWSKPISGTGGSMLVDLAKGAQKATDECYKMAYTDALSVACKTLGIGADVYWSKDPTKYSAENDGTTPTPKTDEPEKQEFVCADCQKAIKGVRRKDADGNVHTTEAAGLVESTRNAYGVALCYECAKKRAKA